jgi:predicted  nucleic acid-binding Zn-ribbon protein
MSDSEGIEKLVESNAKAIQALTERTNELAKAIQALTDLSSSILPRLDDMQRQMVNTQRQMIDNQRRIDDNTADIRELTLENQRILKYLESGQK